MVQEKWNGHERRKSTRDHDTLIEMVQILKNHVGNFDIHRKDYLTHIGDDKKNFEFLNRVAWCGFGGLGVLEIILRIIGK